MAFSSPEQFRMIQDYSDLGSGIYILTHRMLNKIAAENVCKQSNFM